MITLALALDNIICLTVTLNGVTIQFKDSYLLLPSSLAKLAEGFNVTSPP